MAQTDTNKNTPRKSYFQDDDLSGKVYDAKLLRHLAGYVKPHKALLVIAILCLLCVTGFQIVGPLITRHAIDVNIAQGDARGLLFMIMLYFMVLGGQLLTIYLQGIIVQYIGQKVMHDLRIQIFSHVQRLSLPFFDRNPVGRLMTRLMNDVGTINELFSSGFLTILTDVLTLGGIVAIMVYIDWWLALVTLSVVPVMMLVTFEFRKRVRTAFRLTRGRLAALNADLQENIAGMREVHLFHREQRNAEKFDHLNLKLLDAMHQTVWNFAIYYPAMEILGALGIALIIWQGGAGIVAGTVTFGTIFAFVQYSKTFWRPIMDLSEKYQILQSSMASMERVFRLLEAENTIKKEGAEPEPEGLRGHIEFKDVWFSYPESDEWVLKGVSFEVTPGSSLAIVGATGAGKSSIIKLIGRLYDYQKGQILIDGRDIRTLDPQWLRQQMATVLQDVFLFAGDVTHNIGLSNPDITTEQVEEAARVVNAAPFIDRLPEGYATQLKERGALLSSGQKQLLSFARALAHDPAVLILDEATANIDSHHEALIQEALGKLLQGRTSIIIAHRLSTIVNSETILVLHKGKVEESGNHQELLGNRGLYWRLYQLQYKDEAGEPITAK